MRTLRNRQSGFSLIELMIAVVILAVGLLGLAELQVTAVKGNAKSGSIMAATQVAQTALEEVMAVRYKDDPLYNSVINYNTAVFEDWPSDPVRDVAGVGSFKITFTSDPDTDPAVNPCRFTRIEVRVESVQSISQLPTTVTLEGLKNCHQVVVH